MRVHLNDGRSDFGLFHRVSLFPDFRASSVDSVFPIARGSKARRARGMGSKYVPSIKDLKADRRFQQKLHIQSKFIKPASKPRAAKPDGRKASPKS